VVIQALAYEIIDMKARLSMTFSSHFLYINRVEKDKKDHEDEDVELVKPLNQFMTPLTPKLKYVSEYAQYVCND